MAKNLEVTIIFEFMVTCSTIIKNSDSLSPILWDVVKFYASKKFYGSKRPVERFSAKVIIRVTDS